MLIPPTFKRHSSRKQCAYCGVTLTAMGMLPPKRNQSPAKLMSYHDKRTWDHIIPHSCGGKIMIPCCGWCNGQKGDQSLSDWLASDNLKLRTAMVNEREKDAEPMHERILYQLRDEDLFRIRTSLEYHAE